MYDLIANVLAVDRVGQELTDEIESELAKILDEAVLGIGQCRNIREADRFLDKLGEFQTELARAIFKWRIDLPSRFHILVRKFDRSDDPDERMRVFREIKSGTFFDGVD